MAWGDLPYAEFRVILTHTFPQSIITDCVGGRPERLPYFFVNQRTPRPYLDNSKDI